MMMCRPCDLARNLNLSSGSSVTACLVSHRDARGVKHRSHRHLTIPPINVALDTQFEV